MERPTSTARKLIENQDRYLISIRKQAIEDLGWNEGDWIDEKLITTGRHAGTLRLQPVEKEEDDKE